MPKLLAKSLMVLILGTILVTDPSSGGVQAEKQPLPAPTRTPAMARPSPTFAPVMGQGGQNAPRSWNW